MQSDEFMNAEDVARYLHLGKNTVYQLAKTGKLASYHVGRKLKFMVEDVDAYVASTYHKSEGASNGAAAPGSRWAAQPQAPTNVSPSESEDDANGDLLKAASFGMLGGEPFVIAGGDPVADMLMGLLNAQGVHSSRLVRGSYTALVNLYAGEADAAVIHLYDQATNSFNVPYVRNLAPGASVIVFRLYCRDQGFIVRRGNPKNITTWGSLLRDGVRLSNRQKGSGARVLLDEKLRAMEARSELIEGYDTHHAVGSTAVKCVSAGLADVAIGTEREARTEKGIQFIPMQGEWVDLVVSKTAKSRPVIKRLKEVFAGSRLRADMAALAPCDTSKLGIVIYES